MDSNTALSWWEFAGYVATAAVMIGCIGESVVEFTDWIGSPANKRSVGRGSAIVLIAGLAFEILAQVQINVISNKIIADLDSENLHIRERIAARRISKEQHDLLVWALSQAPGTFDIQVMQEGEAAQYASDILKTLADAHWIAGKKEDPLGEAWTGLIVFQTDDPAALRLATALKVARIPFFIGDNQHKKARATIMVGSKPPAF